MSNLAERSYDDLFNISMSQTVFFPTESYDNDVAIEHVKSLSVVKVNNTDLAENITLESNSMDVESYSAKSENLEGEFHCVIDSVDSENRMISARVYDIKNKVQVMVIDSSFDEFLEDEQSKIMPNATFYWRMGMRTHFIESKTKKNQNTKLFSEFRMRLSYVSKRAVATRLASRLDKFDNIFV